MKRLIVVLAILAVAATAMADGRSLEGSIVTLIEPVGAIAPDAVYTFRFLVENYSDDYEYVSDIELLFPSSIDPVSGTQGWEPGPWWSYSTGNWEMFNVGIDVIWGDADGGWGELEDYEDVYIFVDAYVNGSRDGGTRGVIEWYLHGDESGSEPHLATGTIELDATPIGEQTWSAIKAMYR